MVSPTPLAFSPGSITCFFRPGLHDRPEETFSRGCAITLEHGVTAAVRPAAALAMRLNGRRLQIAPVRHVATALAPEPVELLFETPLPLGCGFGVSASCTLTAAFALQRRFGLPLDRAQLGMAAHVAEVVNRTGLGDVAAQLTGGIVHRRCVAGPLDAVPLDVPAPLLYYRVFGDIATSEVLRSPGTMALLVEEGDRALAWLEEQGPELTVEALLDRSLLFTRRTGLLREPAVVRAITEVKAVGGHAAMILLGQSIVAARPGPDAGAWTACHVDRVGTRWLP